MTDATSTRPQMGDEEFPRSDRNRLYDCLKNAGIDHALVSDRVINGALAAMSRVRASLPQPTAGSRGKTIECPNCNGNGCSLCGEAGFIPASYASTPAQSVLVEANIKHMVQRFLCWKLPNNFNPDNGISFDPIANKGHAFESRREPVGTNLFDAAQAETMVRYMIEDITDAPTSRVILERIRSNAVAALECTKSARTYRDMRRYVQQVIDGIDVELALSHAPTCKPDLQVAIASPQPDRESETWFPICVTAGEILKDGRVGIKFVWPEEIGTKGPSVTDKSNGPNYAIRALTSSNRPQATEGRK